MQVEVDSREVMMFSTEYNRFITIVSSIKCDCELGSSSESARESVSFDLVAVNMKDGLLLTSLNASSISRTPVPMCSLACSLIPSSSTVMLVGVTAKNSPMVLISEHPSGSLTCGDAVINVEGGETNVTVLAGGVEAGMLIPHPSSLSLLHSTHPLLLFNQFPCSSQRPSQSSLNGSLQQICLLWTTLPSPSHHSMFTGCDGCCLSICNPECCLCISSHFQLLLNLSITR